MMTRRDFVLLGLTSVAAPLALLAPGRALLANGSKVGSFLEVLSKSPESLTIWLSVMHNTVER
jgi:hypothetical protein